MLSQVAALKRLRFYEDSLRRNVHAVDPSTREELRKFQEAFHRAASELETMGEQLHQP